MTKAVDWDAVEIGNEAVSEDDLNSAENSGKLPNGKWLAECVATKARVVDMKDRSSIAASLEWEVLEALEIDGIPAKNLDDKRRRMYEGRKVFDDVFMEEAGEPDWARNRRLQIAKRCGLIPPGGGRLTKQSWASDIIGKRIVVTTETQEGKDGKKYQGKVPMFDGYVAVEDFLAGQDSGKGGGKAAKGAAASAPAPSNAADSMDDI